MTINLRACLILALLTAGLPAAAHDSDTIVQYSTLGALEAGIDDGEMTYCELAGHDDFGTGTLNAIDGEMVGFGETFRQVREDSSITLDAIEAAAGTLAPGAANR